MANHRAARRDRRRTTPATPGPAHSAGRRKATRSAPANPLARALPSAPVLVGVAALAVSTGGAISVTGPDTGGEVRTASANTSLTASNALGGSADVGRVSSREARSAAVTRDSRRDALAEASDQDLKQAAEAQSQQRDAALAQFAKQAEQHAAEIARNAWVLPVDSYRLTNTFGVARSYYSSGYHTGLDFAAPSGTPVKSVANGVVTEAGYDGSYGNKVVIRHEDGTELWYAHLSGFDAQVGDSVSGGDVIGYVGSTGNSTGPHLHLEVRPGAGDAVDPHEALVVHGLTP